MNQKRRFSGRALTSCVLTFSFLAMAFSGVVLFVTPRGRVANWTGWELLGITKHQWGALHICFAVVFLVGSLIHIYLNWKRLLTYFKSRLTHRYAFRWEWAVSLVFCVLIGAGALWEIPPLSSLMSLNDRIKDSWEQEERAAPVPHAELLTLTELAEEANLGIAEALTNLHRQGIAEAGPESVVGELAERYGKTPEEIHSLAGRQTHGAGGGGNSGQGQGRGYGRMTFREYCTAQGLDPARTMADLEAGGFSGDMDMVLRDLAEANGMRPPELVDLLLQGK